HGWDKPPFPGEYPVILFSSESGIFTENRLTQFDGFFHGGSSGDFDNDGDLDVIMNTNQKYKFGAIYLENDGYGNFTENENLGPLSETHSEESNMNFFQNYLNSEMYDINKDGYLDILFMTAQEGEKNFDFIPFKVQYTNTILYGNGSDFTGEVISLPTVEGWPEVYDVEFFDLDGNGTEEIIFNRNKFRDTYQSWYIQILEKVGDKYIDNTNKYIDINENVSGIEKYHTWLEIRDYDNDGIIEMRNNTPKQVEEHAQLYIPNNVLFYSEWELINGKLIKVD
ncbi:VCBS repeat-containing protein, partial [Flavobacteriaceae bacterium]|nr:VCBS repeat-containing protein [Flavobacteriaceae bacterium]